MPLCRLLLAATLLFPPAALAQATASLGGTVRSEQGEPLAEGTAFPPPAFGAGPRAADLDALRGQLPPREIRETFALGLEQPTSWQATLGWQR